MAPQREEQARKDKEEEDRLSAELISKTEWLLENHGVVPVPNLSQEDKIIRRKFRTVLSNNDWIFGRKPATALIVTTTLTDKEGEPIDVNIVSGLDIKESCIDIYVQGVNTSLTIPKNRKQPFPLLGTNQHATLRDIKRYRDVIDMIKERLPSPTHIVSR